MQVDRAQGYGHMRSLLSKYVEPHDAPTFGNREEVGKKDSLEQSLKRDQTHD